MIREAAARGPYFSEKGMMIEVLKDLCHFEGWYKLKDVADAFKAKANWSGNRDDREVSRILNLLGFTQRKRLKRGSYIHVFVNPAAFPALTKSNATGGVMLARCILGELLKLSYTLLERPNPTALHQRIPMLSDYPFSSFYKVVQWPR